VASSTQTSNNVYATLMDVRRRKNQLFNLHSDLFVVPAVTLPPHLTQEMRRDTWQKIPEVAY
jgi:hypothetical protein